jgi:hypothetical protein
VSVGRASTITIDQSFTTGNNLIAVINDCCAFIGQTYSAGLTGTLAGVAVDVVESEDHFPLDVQIRSVVNGLPTTSILGEATATSFGLNNLITFTQSIPQIANVQYAIVVHFLGAPPPGPGHAVGSWAGATGNLYTGGEHFISFDNGISWFPEGADFDTHFVTEVNTAASVPEPTTLFLMATGIAGLILKRRDLRRPRNCSKLIRLAEMTLSSRAKAT